MSTDAVIPRIRKPDWRNLFAERLRFEGRHDDLQREIAALLLETGKKRVEVLHEARLRCGFVSAEEEYRLAHERGTFHTVGQDDPHITPEIIASLGLPAQCPFHVEIDWLCAHPQMVFAKDRLKDEPTPDALRLADVIKPPHGRAPSVHAVSMLQYYRTKPGDFHKMMANLAKEGGTGGNAESEHDLEQIAGLLKELGESV